MGRELENIDLTPAQLREVKKLLKSYLPNTEVWGYGSRVRFTAKPHSDLDLVAFSSSEQQVAIYNLKEAFEESSLSFRVDLYVWDEIPEQFHKNIKKERIVLQKKSKNINTKFFKTTTYRLSDAINIIGGGTPKRSNPNFWGGSIPWLSVVDFNSDSRFVTDAEERITQEGLDKSSAKLLEKGQLIIFARGTVGCIAEVTKPMAFNQSCYGLSGKESIVENDYLYYIMKLKISELRQKTHDAVFDTITKETFNHVDIEIPDNCGIRKSIVKILGDLDEKIQLNRQTNQTLEQIALAIFKSWFVDFDPVKAKIIAREKGGNKQAQSLAAQAIICGAITLQQLEKTQPGEQGLPHELHPLITQRFPQQSELNNWTPETLQKTADLFPDVLVESELGEVPEGWEWSEIGSEVKIVGGGTPSTKNTDFWEGGDIHWTTPKDMSNLADKILLDTNRKITEAGLEKISSGLLPKNTVLMSSRAPVGYLAITKIPVAINQGYIAMKCDYSLTPEYVVQWAESVMDDIKQRASGTTFAEISKKNFKIIPVIVPVDDVLNEYTNVVTDLYSKITEGIRETRYLTGIRDTLLPKLLSGEININLESELQDAIKQYTKIFKEPPPVSGMDREEALVCIKQAIKIRQKITEEEKNNISDGVIL